MRTIRMRMAGLFAVPVALFAALDTAPATESRPGTSIVLRAGPSVGQTFVATEPVIGPRRAATINVTYHGFPRAAKKAFQRAVNVWKQLLNSPVPITVDATFEPLGAGILGSAGTSFIHRNFANAPRPNTFFVDAIANRHAGVQLNPAPDIVARFSSSFPNWHYGLANAPANKYDFTAVVLHELGHGLGFIGGGFVDGSGKGFIRFGNPANHIIYSAFVENNGGASILTFAEGSAALGNQLKSNALFLDSRAIRKANRRKRAKIFAPSPFQGGSSYSHLDEATFKPGNKNSLMTPFLGQGETIRDPGPITRALFGDLGWNRP